MLPSARVRWQRVPWSRQQSAVSACSRSTEGAGRATADVPLPLAVQMFGAMSAPVAWGGPAAGAEPPAGQLEHGFLRHHTHHTSHKHRVEIGDRRAEIGDGTYGRE